MLLKYAADLTQVGHWSCLSKVKPIINQFIWNLW